MTLAKGAERRKEEERGCAHGRELGIGDGELNMDGQDLGEEGKME